MRLSNKKAISQIVPRNHVEAVAEMHHSMKWYTAQNLQSKAAVKVLDLMNQRRSYVRCSYVSNTHLSHLEITQARAVCISHTS